MKRVWVAVVLGLGAACGKKAPESPAPGSHPPSPVVKNVWVETDPVQCKGNPWDQYTGIGGVTGFFDEKGIKVYNTATISYNQLYLEPVSVCRQCSCPKGEVLYLWVARSDTRALQSYGFRPSSVDPLNPDSYVGSRRPKNAPPPASAAPGPKLSAQVTPRLESETAAPAPAQKPVKKKLRKRRTRS